MRPTAIARLMVTIAAGSLAACGGGGAGGVEIVSTPTPIPTPTPPPAPAAVAVQILADPPVGDLASLGTWTNLGGTNGEWNIGGVPSTPARDARIPSVRGTDSDPVRIRFTSAGNYEVQLPGAAYERLIHDSAIANPSPDDPFLRLGSGNFFTIHSSQRGFRYSAMASWWRPDNDFAFTADFGSVAFGTPTPAGAVPVTGSASYQGFLTGITDAKFLDSKSGAWVLFPADGTVALDFNFATGALGGQMRLSIPDGLNPFEIGTYAFRQTVFSPGSTTYSGNFETSLAGFNFFNGRFTGPKAEETIGNWAVPFTYNGENHQAIGVWVAKNGH